MARASRVPLVALLIVAACTVSACGDGTDPIPDVQIALDPTSAVLAPLEEAAFTATVTGAGDASVTWATTGGTISGTGTTIVYVSPATAGAYQLTATSVADPDASATASITVEAPAGEAIAKLTSTDAAAGDRFGHAVAIDGTILVVGAPYADGAYVDAGAAYVFERDATGWTQRARLTAGDAVADALFGWSVAVDGETVVVGTLAEPFSSVYVFVRAGGAWTLQQSITASDRAQQDRFGAAVAIDGDLLLVGADRKDDASTDAGAVYLYTRTQASWSEQGVWTASDAAPYDRFGYDLDLDGATAVVGAYGQEGRDPLSGAAYVFHDDGGGWTEQAVLSTSPFVDGDRFGQTVALRADAVVVGARTDDAFAKDSGSVHLFTGPADDFATRTKLVPDDGAADMEFGRAVAIDGELLAVSRVGAPGKVYLFDASSAGTWPEIDAYSVAGASFGTDVAVSGATVLIGADLDDELGENAGSAYVVETGP